MTSLEVFILLFLSCMIERSISLSCPCWSHDANPSNPLSYRETYCNDLDLTCPSGSEVISDHCGCCKVCSHVEDEECGGPWNVLGRCAKDFECIDPKTKGPLKGSFLGNIPMGTCRRIKRPDAEHTPSTPVPRRSKPVYPPGFSLMDFFGPFGPQRPVNQEKPVRKNKEIKKNKKDKKDKKDKKLNKDLRKKSKKEKKERRERKMKEERREDRRKISDEVSNEIPKYF
ncbi:insulin-like growth factor-binding protein 2 [Strongylocentrotus purpuratus]|uniref:IGFBP N-terminal domain-containing protein n=1 Tax=Strongylocentrotus purpuratus TaxID=7668 RepID=A0A7M7GML6_STRPU|nr:insulin-like growth factor-binding protein 2 [Strongylocentrotus purpuratus]|eukprot:XP_003729949.1 PREDICTED: insulin-like growth factor-binding protein 2 [Strongylocentrotus purpuratus]